ncbi:hypothetical protein [Croceicoccus mobilis]|uniref:EF-hand domain-containing protein n=1 Tax=Croceicoccus mobilis TaxID=1703339 RepID=A0A916YXE2_9SPHN|nr:hypothetical protein [Croceicoccus mobilis]GGD65158.1 hypothetical protein GCM10010990_13320 [Croceicoccus mobilis]
MGRKFTAFMAAALLGSTGTPLQAQDSVEAEAITDEGDGTISQDQFARMLAAMASGESMMSGVELNTAIEAAQAHPLGTADNPVRTTMPEGEAQYLDALRCSDNRPPAYRRLSSGGTGPYGNIVDYFEVACPDTTHEIVMDMYHGGYVESEAVPGFTIDAWWKAGG